MNKALLLLLATLVQSQSDGIRLPEPTSSDKCDENLDGVRPEEWKQSAFSYGPDPSQQYDKQTYAKRSATDVLTRRSALDKNFMRFGRNSRDSAARNYFRDGGSDLVRFGRGLIRLGAGSPDGLIRFDRGSKDSFIRFGRSDPEDFFRYGKSTRDNFIRFGKADKNFMRFGRAKPWNGPEFPEQPFERYEKTPRTSGNFLRFGKSGNQKEGRNGTNFLRFGKKDSGEENREPEYSDFEVEDAGRARTRREAAGGKTGQVGTREAEGSDDRSGNSKTLEKRSPKFFEKTLENFSKFTPVVASDPWENSNSLRNSRLIPHFFPSPSVLPRDDLETYLYWRGAEAKRNQGGSNFIRFG